VSTAAREMPRAGASLLVLGSGNVDENLRGYYTKYDASVSDTMSWALIYGTS
jgi:NAD+ synthase (glutamine-hydrolysing)